MFVLFLCLYKIYILIIWKYWYSGLAIWKWEATEKFIMPHRVGNR